MLSQSKSLRLRFVVSMCMVLAAGAVSMGTSCITAPKGKGGNGGNGGTSGATGGTINGTVDSLGDNAPIGAGVTVTATDSASGVAYVATTSSTGTYSIANVPKGDGTITLSTLPTGCTVPAAVNYTGETNGGTLSFNIIVNCPIQLP
jgi:hypothetical protein